MKKSRHGPEPRITRSMPWDPTQTSREVLLDREWLVTNGLGGYASGTVSGAVTRRYHGLLVAALPAPLGRMVMWSHVSERIRFAEHDVVSLGAQERACGQLNLGAADCLREFRLEDGLPVWTYQVRDLVVEKRILLPHQQNTVHVSYRFRGRFDGGGALLELRPGFHFRHYSAPVNESPVAPYRLMVEEGRYEIAGTQGDLPPFRMRLTGCESSFHVQPEWIRQVVYRTELARGHTSEGELWSPGMFEVGAVCGCTATIIGSTEPWEIADVLPPDQVLAAECGRRTRLLAQAGPAAKDDFAAEMILAADQFLIKPAGRIQDAARAQAAGDEVRTVVAGYHWFTDWGRDTMISLEGLTLTTGRCDEAGYILRTFAQCMRNGLIPNMFPDGLNDGLYHTADATLWFFHALDRYLSYTGDELTLRQLLPALVQSVEAHLQGTRFHIRVDPADGLLTQGEEGYALTWMDAKMGDWVVTPRRGKAVELNALWFNALKLLSCWLRQIGDPAAAERYETHAAQTRASFNERFWDESTGYLYDVIDCDGETGQVDNACRPNQILAISLHHPVLEPAFWAPVLETVHRELVTPAGLRSLSPRHPDYQPIYSGDLRSRDGAYHQGTVWAWLIGPFIDAWRKVHPDDPERGRQFLVEFPRHLDEAGLGTINEVFDARAPHQPGGCIAQAWSVAEVLRCWASASREITQGR